MPDFGAPQKGYTVPLAPETRHFFRLGSERPIVLRHVGNLTQAKAGNPGVGEPGGDMKKQAIDCIEVLGDFLDHHDMATEIGHETGAEDRGQRHQVESCDRGTRDLRLETVVAPGHPGQRPADCMFSSLSPDIDRHRAMHGSANPFAIESGKKEAAVGVAEKGLVCCASAQLRDRFAGNAVRAVAAFCKPHRRCSRVVGTFQEGREPYMIRTGKMSLLGKALFVKCQFQVGKLPSGKLCDRLGDGVADRRGRRADGDTGHLRPLAALHNSVSPA